MVKCIELAKKISKSDLSVLIIGESGTGKELLSQSIHNASNRSNQPFIAVNCAAVPDSLLESQLFDMKRLFTGALREGKRVYLNLLTMELYFWMKLRYASIATDKITKGITRKAGYAYRFP